MLNEIETKLLRLALDKGAQDGEIDNAAIMLIRKLRKRNASVDDVVSTPEPSRRIASVYAQATMPFGKHKGKSLSSIPGDYLVWVLHNCQNITPYLRSAIQERLTDVD